ncbi:MAG: XRE family transcriptional regulator [Acidobacteriales bacterium]|nr:XRE family transcriptional regulator [Terriglobales bacterium]
MNKKKTPQRNPKPPSRRPGSSELVSSQLSVRVKKLREQKRWSLETLSAACGVSRAMLSQIERGQVNPTLAVTFNIARAFEMSIGELVEMPGVSSSIQVIRANDSAYDFRGDKDCRVRTLSPLNLEKDVELYEVRLARGGALRSTAHFTGTREFLAVESGRVRIESGGDHEDLAVGDSVSYRADVNHAIVNIGDGDAVVFLVDIYR